MTTTKMPRSLLAGLLVCVSLVLHTAVAQVSKREPNYYGKYIARFPEGNHGITGTVYAVDESTFFIKNFTFDGQAPAAYFWVGNEDVVGPSGTPLPYPESKSRNPQPLGRYVNADVILRLPSNMKIRDIKWLSVWCHRFTVNFAHIFIPSNLSYPSIRVLPEFKRLAHGLRSDNITILDSKTFYIPNLHYDGAGPDAYFWVGRGNEPNQYGMKIPNEVNKTSPLNGYEGVDIEVVLPGNLTVYDIDYLAVWCVQYKHNFGHVLIPKDLDVPPALGQTKIAPAWWYVPTSSTAAPDLDNCIELLDGRVQVQWKMMDDDVQIRVSAYIREDQYVAFGISGVDGRAEMIGADVVVIGYNKETKKFIAEDYYMSEYSQCNGVKGVCPDHRIGGKNDAVLITGKRNNGVTSGELTRADFFFFPSPSQQKGKSLATRYHPFYITDSPEGGFSQLTEEQQRHQRVFAGVAYDRNNYPYPTAVGRYCEYGHKRTDQSAKTETFEEFFATLKLDCEEGEPGKLVWYVEEDTPDLVYYQCYTHRNLGWKINVVEQGHVAKAESGGGSVAASIALLFVLLAVAAPLR
ncbi:protein Skeletor, isoforms B/C [Copidosoma floridanum]|uniref:protein Skeletor, isoforms B/C n=1 Tax=Copidosoma floridanum TaxID=29053 RepID=UPI0006C96738|nr:protein Skeletor, isoforms B/C [Copidosoma floridanum]